MSDLIRRAQTDVFAVPASIRGEIEHYEALPEGLRELWRPAWRPDAAAIADALRAEQNRRASPEIIAEWLLVLRGAVVESLTSDQYRARVGAILNVLGGDLPAYCWTTETLKLAARRLQWFPTVHDLDALLRPLVDEREKAIRFARLSATAPRVNSHAVEGAPYAVTSTPDWAYDRGTRHFRPGREIHARPPERTVEEQLRAFGLGPDGQPLSGPCA